MDRQRVSITLKESVLKALDQKVDGMRIRNRSHAVEYYLAKALSPGIGKVAILAGGPGTKLRPFTYEIPKALIPIHGKPLLEHTLNLLQRHGLTDVCISIGHLGEQIRDHLGSGKRFGMNISYSDQSEYVGTGGALRALSGFVREEPFLIVHGDILVDIDLEDLMNFHEEHDYAITLALTSDPDPSSYGTVSVKRTQVVDFSEKPQKGLQTSHLINAGVYVAEASLLESLSAKTPSSLEQEVLPRLAKEGKVGAYVFDGRWFDVTTPVAYEKALQEW